MEYTACTTAVVEGVVTNSLIFQLAEGLIGSVHGCGFGARLEARPWGGVKLQISKFYDLAMGWVHGRGEEHGSKYGRGGGGTVMAQVFHSKGFKGLNKKK